MSTSTVQLCLQIVGQQAQQQMQRLNLNINQGQQQQRQNLNQILNVQQRINTSTQQNGRYGQQQLRTGQKYGANQSSACTDFATTATTI